jgi:hypothetical protein
MIGYYKNYQDLLQHKFNLEKLKSELEKKIKNLLIRYPKH